MASKGSKKQSTQSVRKDDFKSVAERLGCDPDLKKFDAQLRKIAKRKTQKAAT